MAQQSLYGDYSFTLNSATPTLKITTTGHNSYSQVTGNDPWQVCHYVDGNLINTIGGAGAGTECPVLVSIIKNAAAGSHTLRVTWSGASNITFSGDTTTVEANFK